jgi:hypothetical protein
MSATPDMYWHDKSCQCQGCQQARLQRHYGYVPGPLRHGPYGRIAGILVALVILAVVISLCDPHVSFPVISQVVCSFKGGSWSNGNILQPAGCYAP